MESVVLEARESRAKHINDLRNEFKNKTIIILKTNVVGTDKNPIHLKFICAFYSDIIHRTFYNKILNSGHTLSNDGDYCYFIVDEKGLIVKEKTIEIEESSSLGRLIDIDVYNEKSFSREDLSCEMRKCLLCDNYAHVCSRNQTHSQEDLFNKMSEIIEQFLNDYLTNIAIRAIYSELELYPKFGLVSHRDSGCHDDMDYETFVSSTFAIKKYISKYIKEGFKKEINPFTLQKIGLKAEEKMFKATNNVNTHKGLIFLLGIFLPALANTIMNNESKKFMQNRIKQISETIISDYYETLESKESLTNSDRIYLKYGIKGIREEVLNGLQLIFDIPSYDHLNEDDQHQEYIIHLMSELNDTTIIHKTDINTLNQVKMDMKKIVDSGGYKNNVSEVMKLSDEYKEKHISPGGSADMLVVKIIYEEVKYLLK